MRWLLVSLAVLAVAMLGAGAALADYDYVDIGDPDSETGHNLVGWGPIEPEASGGTYGGIDDCRVIYAFGELPDENWATLELDFGPATLTGKCLLVRHLDGQSGTDYWYVTVNGDYVGDHDDSPGGGEYWILSEFDVSGYSGLCTVKFISTEDPWSGFDPYGQVSIDEVSTCACGGMALDETSWGAVKALYR